MDSLDTHKKWQTKLCVKPGDRVAVSYTHLDVYKRQEQEKAQELEALREQTEQQLLQIQHKYDAEHDKISDEILQSMIRT